MHSPFPVVTEKAILRRMLKLPDASADRMQSVHEYSVPPEAFALWFLGQNGFLLKTHAGTHIAIDPYLSNSCAERHQGYALDLNRVTPIPILPEHLEVDYVVFTHSHEDHLDLDTIRVLPNAPTLIAPWEAMEKLRELNLPEDRLILLHPQQTIQASDTTIQGIFAFPTDQTDVNHIGVLFTIPGEIRFYNTGDTAYSPLLAGLLPENVDICAICINGGFRNLSHGEAARIVSTIAPDIAVPTHFDVMACNLGNPEMFRAALIHENSSARYCCMDTDHLFLYEKRVH